MNSQILLNSEPPLEKAYNRLNILFEISCAMRATLELKHILYIILTGVTAHSGLGYNRALLYLVNAKSRSLECKMALGPKSVEEANRIWQYLENANYRLHDLIQLKNIPHDIECSPILLELKNLKFPLHSKKRENFLLTNAYQKGTCWIPTNNELEQYLEDPFFQKFQSDNLIIMPLKAHDIVNGLLIADNKFTQKEISEEDLKIFTMLGNQAGLAVKNSRLYEMVVKKSHTDSVTQLWNHGYFQDKLSEELQKARKDKNPLNLIMMDIDNFKSINDNYGHQFGDILLKKIANILKKSSREVDYACRYGGDEFAIILGNTSQKQAMNIAERIRKRIENHCISAGKSCKNIQVTVSIGLSGFPENGKTREELIANTDKAMYIAKFIGKNRICRSESEEELKNPTLNSLIPPLEQLRAPRPL